MSREIKYRAWDKETGKMYYQINKPRTNENINDELIIQFDCTGYSARTSNKYIGSDCLMQYTGLLDKNGKEIYEGDIIRIKPNPKDYGGYKGHNYIEYVFWNEEEACYDIAIDRTWLLLKSDIEIIGNIYEHKYNHIHDNPELIGGGNS